MPVHVGVFRAVAIALQPLDRRCERDFCNALAMRLEYFLYKLVARPQKRYSVGDFKSARLAQGLNLGNYFARAALYKQLVCERYVERDRTRQNTLPRRAWK